MTVRTQVNRGLAVPAVVVALVAVALAERLRRGAGRPVARRCVRAVGRACGLTFEVRGADRLDPGADYVLVPNHSSPLDIPAMLLARDHIRFLAAAELFRIPLLAGAMRALDTEPIDRHDTVAAYRQLAELARQESRRSLVVFAEGGIAPAGERLPFRNGAFTLAIETGAPVVPVAVHCTGELLPPGARLAVRPGTVVVELLDPVPTAALTAADRDQLRDRVQAAVARRLAAGP